MTQADVAKKIGISRQMFCYKEAGKTEWKLKELEGLAVVFGVSVRDLLGD
jgi:DNA-binding XRE family transcriptional regulator